MAVVIRFARHGSKKRPFYRVVAADQARARDGRFLEILGTYNPANKETKLKNDRIEHWVNQGALGSKTVCQLLKKNGLKAPSAV
ncbi:MAG: 30S ribosomal protein S16 [Deltaproteobacteria bacterium]|nr:30S ribosomal protein S16 [Deltaproteobacteria bacterium]